MDAISSEWGFPMAVLGLLAVIAIFGFAYRFIRSATESNKRLRWFQIIGRRERQRRSGDSLPPR